jgi:hypothetical protein
MPEKIITTPDISRITKEYVNKWVALSEDYKKVIAQGETLEEVLGKTRKEKKTVVLRVLPNLGYAPSATSL